MDRPKAVHLSAWFDKTLSPRDRSSLAEWCNCDALFREFFDRRPEHQPTGSIGASEPDGENDRRKTELVHGKEIHSRSGKVSPIHREVGERTPDVISASVPRYS